MTSSPGRTPALRGINVTSRSHSLDGERETQPVDPVPRTYECAQGHETVMPFAEGAEYPTEWDCTTCYKVAFICDADAEGAHEPEDLRAPVLVQKTHYQHLMERRTVEELASLFEERLEALRNKNHSV